MADPGPRIIVSGATGLTGNAVAHELARTDGAVLAGCVSPSAAANPARTLPVTASVAPTLAHFEAEADVVADFSVAEALPEMIDICIDRGWHLLVGTTGVDQALLDLAGERFAAAGLGLLYAPNFSLGAVLAMQLAEELARRFPSIEVIEYHRAGKLDAPSGTAALTAERLSAIRAGRDDLTSTDTTAAARGQQVGNVPVHSVRLEGAVAHQTVIAGGPGEMLSLRHDAVDRSCYASGVLLAARAIAAHPGLTIGLEKLL